MKMIQPKPEATFRNGLLNSQFVYAATPNEKGYLIESGESGLKGFQLYKKDCYEVKKAYGYRINTHQPDGLISGSKLVFLADEGVETYDEIPLRLGRYEDLVRRPELDTKDPGNIIKLEQQDAKKDFIVVEPQEYLENHRPNEKLLVSKDGQVFSIETKSGKDYSNTVFTVSKDQKGKYNFDEHGFSEPVALPKVDPASVTKYWPKQTESVELSGKSEPVLSHDSGNKGIGVLA